jgi:uncharacterized protein
VIEQLVALAKIADIDAEALRTETELREIPARIEGLLGDAKKLSELLAAEKHDLADADRLLAAQDDELSNQNQALAKSKQKGAKARNMREADAVEREVETVRRLMKERETERETLKEAIAKRKVSVDKHEKELNEFQSYTSKEKEAGEQRVAELRQKLDEVLKGRAALVTKVPADVLRRYDMIRGKRQGLGVAFVKDNSCSGCFVVLTPQQVIGISRGEEFAQCPRCNRLLYSRELVQKWEAEHAS